MSNEALIELGRRLAARRGEARLSVEALAQRAHLSPSQLEAFETARGTLNASALVRLARALGVPEGSFLHTAAPEVSARREPSFLLREASQGAMLTLADRNALTAQLYRARSFAELGEIVGGPALARRLQPRPAKQHKPYQAGYDLATSVRRMLGNEQDPLRDLRTHIEDDFNILVVEHRFEDPRVHAATCRSGDARLIAISTSIGSEPSRRAILGHELAHQLADLGEDDLIADQDDSKDEGYTAQRPPEEQRASAFSIMLLVPRRALSAMFGSKRFGHAEAPSVISSCRMKFGVGFQAMTWHLFHTDYLNFSEDTVMELASQGDGLDVAGFESPPTDTLARRIEDALARHLISEGRARILRNAALP